jgi:hypothetical protein
MTKTPEQAFEKVWRKYQKTADVGQNGFGSWMFAKHFWKAALASSALTWSNEPPTEPGWYWIRRVTNHGTAWIHKIEKDYDGTLKVWDDEMGLQTMSENCEYVGPILPPLPGERNTP